MKGDRRSNTSGIKDILKDSIKEILKVIIDLIVPVKQGLKSNAVIRSRTNLHSMIRWAAKNLSSQQPERVNT